MTMIMLNGLSTEEASELVTEEMLTMMNVIFEPEYAEYRTYDIKDTFIKRFLKMAPDIKTGGEITEKAVSRVKDTLTGMYADMKEENTLYRLTGKERFFLDEIICVYEKLITGDFEDEEPEDAQEQDDVSYTAMPYIGTWKSRNALFNECYSLMRYHNEDAGNKEITAKAESFYRLLLDPCSFMSDGVCADVIDTTGIVPKLYDAKEDRFYDYQSIEITDGDTITVTMREMP